MNMKVVTNKLGKLIHNWTKKKSNTKPQPDDQPLDKISIDYGEFFDNQEMSDVTFVFIQDDQDSIDWGQSKKQVEQRIHGHQVILATQSLVFKKMFSQPVGEQNEIIVTDISYETFHSMLRYSPDIFTTIVYRIVNFFLSISRLIYTRHVDLNDKTKVIPLFLAIKKYELTQFSDWVAKQIVGHLSIDNVMKMYEFFNDHNKPEVTSKIGLFIQNNAMLILKDESFIEIQRQTLKFVLSQQQLNAAEIQLFQACIRWAKAECERNSITDPIPAQLRKALGDELFLLRIPTMLANHFLEGPVASGLLDMKEQYEVLEYIVASQKSADTPASDFVSRFKLERRKECEMFSFRFEKSLKFRSAPWIATKTLSTCLQFKSSDDFLLASFQFGCIKNLISTGTVCLFEDSLPISSHFTFGQQNIGENGKKANFYSISFFSPQLISANRTYKLFLHCKLNQAQSIVHESDSQKFTVKYEQRKFQKSSILIDFHQATSSEIYIYNFIMY